MPSTATVNSPRSAVRWILGIAVAAAVGGYWLYPRRVENKPAAAAPPLDEVRIAARAELVQGRPDTIRLPADVVQTMGILVETVRPADFTQSLHLPGSLFLDSNRLARVHSRFAGEVVSVGTIQEKGSDGKPGARRPVRFGDKVAKGTLLAVVWSKEVGEKKSELVDSLSRLKLDKAALERLKGLEKGLVPDRTIREAERAYEADLIAVARAERTLRSWRLPDEEIENVRKEADRLHVQQKDDSVEVDKTWAEVDVVAPFDGTIVEKNVNIGDIVDPSLDLFKIADMTRLGVMANVYEEDLPAVQALGPEERKWKIRLPADPSIPPMSGAFDLIGSIIDPSQHSGAIMGWIDNPEERLRVGQFISVNIEIPQRPGEVLAPDSAVIEEGPGATVFIEVSDAANEFSKRQVGVSRRGKKGVYLNADPTPAQKKRGAAPIRAGEKIVARGAVELAAALANLTSSESAKR